MSLALPAQLTDPVCGMIVQVDRAQAAGLLLEHEGRWVGFCRSGCRRAFLEDPEEHLTTLDVTTARAETPRGLPVLVTTPVLTMLDGAAPDAETGAACCAAPSDGASEATGSC